MERDDIYDLADLADAVEEFLLPHVEEAVESCRQTFESDRYNDNYVFGTQLWRNVWNRFVEAAHAEQGNPFTPQTIDHCPYLSTSDFSVRHHRVDSTTELPNGAEAAKKQANAQLSLWGTPSENDADIDVSRPIVGIVAEPESGLSKVFLGVLIARFEEEYEWYKQKIIYDATTSVTERGDGVPSEPEVKPVVTLDKPDQEEESQPDIQVREDEDNEQQSKNARKAQ